jgi:hypothetical protein
MHSQDTRRGTIAPADDQGSSEPWLRTALKVASGDGRDTNLARYLRFLGWHEGDWLELQVLDTKNRAVPVRGQGFAHANSSHDIFRLAQEADDNFMATGVFLVSNAIDGRISARGTPGQWNQQEKGGGTKDAEIIARRAFYIDCDSDRPRGISATKGERGAAWDRAVAVFKFIAQTLGTDRCLAMGMSGNGGHVHVALADVPADEMVEQLITGVLRALAARFGDDRVKVDTSVSDAKRLSPAFGTVKRKGSHVPERPHRRTFFACHDDVQRLTLDQLRSLHDALVDGEATAETSAPSKRGRTTRRSVVQAGSALDRLNQVPILDVAARLGIDHENPTCPACGATNSGSDVAFLDDSNGLKCLHNTCGARFWRPVDLVAKVTLGIDDLRGTHGVVPHVIDWFRRELNVVVLKTADRHGTEVSPKGVAACADDRPEIIISTEQESVNNAAIAALAAAHPDIYQRGLRLVRVLAGDGDPIVQIAEATLREKLASAARWVNATQNGLMPAHPPGWSVKAVLERRRWSDVRHLRGVVGTPVMRSDGSILSTPGYDTATGLLYLPTCDVGEVPEHPTYQDALRARDELLEVVCDFPFEGEQHKASWVAGTLTSFAIHAIAGPTPMIVVDSNIRGAGKGLVVDTSATIVTGKPFAKMAHVRNDEELEKRITSLGLAGVQACLVDNLRGFFGGAVWELVLTTRHWRGRILSKSEIVDLALDIVWWVTGNNVEIGGDMGRRVIHLRLSSPEERPEEKTAFKHPNLIEWVKQERPRLVRAALTILRAYVVADRPEQAGVRLGSFEDWARLVASAVVWVGLPDPCKTREGLEGRAGSDESRLGAVIDAWVASFGDEGRTAAEVLRLIDAEDKRTSKPNYLGDTDGGEHRFLALRDVLIESMGRDGRMPTARQLGSRLGHFRERNVGGRCFVSEMVGHDKIAKWRVADVRVLRHPAASLVSQKNPQETTRSSNSLEDLRVLAGTDPGPLGEFSTDHDLDRDHVDHVMIKIGPGPKQIPQYPQPSSPPGTGVAVAHTERGDSEPAFQKRSVATSAALTIADDDDLDDDAARRRAYRSVYGHDRDDEDEGGRDLH